MDAVQLEVEHLPNAHAGAPEDAQATTVEGIFQLRDGGEQALFLFAGDVPGQDVLELGQVAVEHQAAGRRLRPAPFGDGVQEDLDI